MELKLKDNYSDTLIFIPQENQNILGKFIDVNLYPHLYKLYPDLFEVVLDEADKEGLKASKQRLKDIIDVILEVEELKEAEENKEN